MKQTIPLARLLLLLTAVAAMASCEVNDRELEFTKTDLLTSMPWKPTALTSAPAYDWYGDGTFATDIFSVLKPCEKDNFETYRTNGMVETNEGPTKCDPADPQTWSVTWRLTDNETKLVWDGTDEYTLLELTNTTLKFRSTFVENGVTYTHVETYEH